MSDHQAIGEVVLEVRGPDGGRRFVRVTESPFLIGRGTEVGNHVQLADRRISRQCAALIFEGGAFHVEDRGQRRGLFINGERAEGRSLVDGDVISFGFEDSYEIVFRASAASESLSQLLTRIERLASGGLLAGSLGKLNLLLEATALLHSQLPLDSILSSMLDHAIAITAADRGGLLHLDADGSRHVRIARRSGGLRLPAESIAPSQTALRMALEQKSTVITEDLALAGVDLQAAQSIIAQQLRAVVVIPLYAMDHSGETPVAGEELLGILYFDSRRPAAFSKLDRQVLDALALEAASILDNARLVQRERERQRFEQELSIAREIQQALLPHGLHDFPHLAVSGLNQPCHTVGGDYFDVFPVGTDRTAFLIADVSGKGLGAALVATMLQGSLSGMSLGTDPAKVFNHINRFFCEHAEVGRYATLFFGLLDRDGRLEYINAGHPSPFLVRKGTAEAVFTAGSFPVGLVAHAEYTSAVVQLQLGDTVVLFSDGVTEAMDPEDQEFGAARLQEVLSALGDVSLEEMQKSVLAAVEDFTRGARQGDDLTLLLARYRAAAEFAPTNPAEAAIHSSA
ncbi:MAG: SpoIIE family protein phosphatase [Candidatus Acidiferrales bacterium]|jgi:serine phosphatase RsbU (regulator of sigma subunit)